MQVLGGWLLWASLIGDILIHISEYLVVSSLQSSLDHTHRKNIARSTHLVLVDHDSIVTSISPLQNSKDRPC